MSKKMNKAPVYFMVAQVQFNPVLSLEVHIASIQDKMRTAGYPDFKREIVHQLILPPGKNESNQPLPPGLAPQFRFIFGNIDGTEGFVFENNALAFQTTVYETFESFLKTFQNGIGIVNDALRLNFTERIGLRYLDTVLPKPKESFLDYLIPEVLGVSHKLSGNSFHHAFSETLVDIAAGQLVSRVIIRDGKVGLPPELATLAPKISDRFTTPKGKHAIIDIDAFYEHREIFDLEKINNKLNDLHEEINKAFNTIVTANALAAWK